MKCPNCGHKNPDGVRKCKACGKKMGLTKREKKVLLTGMLLIALILVAGIVALFMISRHFENSEVTTAQAVRPSIVAPQQSAQQPAQPTPTAEPEPTPEPTATPEPEPTQEPEDAPVAVNVTAGRDSVDLGAYTKADVTMSTESSYIDDPKYDNSAKAMYDGLNYTAWQENVGGSGAGESAVLSLDRRYNVRAVVFKLGNWTDERNYQENNRPKTMTIQIGNESFNVEFTDEMKEQVVQFTKDVPGSEVVLVLGDVYKGTVYDDTCIAEVEFYGT